MHKKKYDYVMDPEMSKIVEALIRRFLLGGHSITQTLIYIREQCVIRAFQQEQSPAKAGKLLGYSPSGFSVNYKKKVKRVGSIK